MASDDSNYIIGNWSSHQQRKGDENEGNVKPFDGDTPEGSGCIWVLLTPEIDAVLKKRHTQQVVRYDESNNLRENGFVPPTMFRKAPHNTQKIKSAASPAAPRIINDMRRRTSSTTEWIQLKTGSKGITPLLHSPNFLHKH